MNYTIKSPETKQEWRKYFSFRWELLRKPWNMPLESLKDDKEERSFHLIALSNQNNVIATGRLHLIDPEEAQIRYMAVDKSMRREGVGSQILLKLEEEANSKSV